MANTRQRRSPRYARELPIRVFGTDFQGADFVEDSTTRVVSWHGAKIQLTHKLIPEMEIRILHQDSKREALFRVVGQAGESSGEFSFWAVECLEPAENIWEGVVAMPASEPGSRPAPLSSPELTSKPGPQRDTKQSSKDKAPAQAWLRCSKCGMRELVDLDETQIQAMRRSKGVVRGCPACGATSLWRGVGVQGS
jgi:hypothetical protein